jgi:uncharacterized protein (DUF885 family)
VLTPLALAAFLAAAPAGEGARLRTLLDEAWQERLREDPLLASAVGDRRYGDRLPGMAREDLDRRAASWRRTLTRLEAIDRSHLAPADRINRDMFERELKEALAEHEFGTWRQPINADSGFHTEFARLPHNVPLATTADYDAYLSRLRAFPVYARQQVALMREGLRAGFTMPRVTLEGYEGTARAHVVAEPEKSVFHGPLAAFPPGVPEGEHPRLRAAGREAVLAAVSGYRELLDFLVREYVPGARTTLGASELPRGREYYAHLVRKFTTLEVTPEEVHRTGLAEVERIQAEMREVVRQTGFAGDFPAFLEHLRTDPRFYAKTPEELLREASWIAKRMDGQLPALFGRLPRVPYTVEPVPADIAPKYTGGRYVEPPIGGTRPGIYWVNTYALESRPFYTLEALTLHEAVPGHHLQIALQQELEGLPEFRRVSGSTAFVEGWALYAERLGLEAGFYKDPYRNFGRLTYEMWRACRLVVDTGLHSMGWSREQALEYMAARTALSRHEVRTETDRYISWPGQALAYKMGELRIRALRKEAEERLGPRFDRRRFHDTVLANGPVPLSVLEEEVRRWIAEEAARR